MHLSKPFTWAVICNAATNLGCTLLASALMSSGTWVAMSSSGYHLKAISLGASIVSALVKPTVFDNTPSWMEKLLDSTWGETPVDAGKQVCQVPECIGLEGGSAFNLTGTDSRMNWNLALGLDLGTNKSTPSAVTTPFNGTNISFINMTMFNVTNSSIEMPTASNITNSSNLTIFSGALYQYIVTDVSPSAREGSMKVSSRRFSAHHFPSLREDAGAA